MMEQAGQGILVDSFNGPPISIGGVKSPKQQLDRA